MRPSLCGLVLLVVGAMATASLPAVCASAAASASASASSSSGVVLADVDLHVSHMDAAAPQCVGPHCRSMPYLFRVRKIGATGGRLCPATAAAAAAAEAQPEGEACVQLGGGTQRLVFIGLRGHLHEGAITLSGTVTDYDSVVGLHLFVADRMDDGGGGGGLLEDLMSAPRLLRRWVALCPRTQEQHDAHAASIASGGGGGGGSSAPLPPSPSWVDSFALSPLQAPSTDSLSGAELSHSFFAWLALPSSSFLVNLNPAQPHRIITPSLGATLAGQTLLRADLRLKHETAFALHPDTEEGWAYWKALDIPFPTPELCLNFRTWIVAARDGVHVVERGDELFVVRAALDVHEESDVADSSGANFAFESTRETTGCASADPLMQAEAERLFRSMALPRIVERVNTAPEFEALRTVFYWRVIAEWYKRQPDSYLSAHSLSSIPTSSYSCTSEAEGAVQSRRVWESYVSTVRAGSYHVRKVHRLGDGRKFARTYAQGCIDWRDVDGDFNVGE